MARKKKRDKLPDFKKFFYSIFIVAILVLILWIQENTSTTRVPQTNFPAELYSNQTRDDLCQTLTHAIREAKHSIALAIYALTDTQVIYALRQKADQGVDVCIVCDAKASMGVDRKLGPKVKLTKRISKGLMHMKILVVDGTKTWLGSANMTDESLRFHGNLMIGVDSPPVASFITSKIKELEKEEFTRTSQHHTFLAGDQKMEMWFLPNDPEAIPKLKHLIKSAEKTMRIAMFTWTRQDLAKEVVQAAKRGVNVEIVIDQNSAKGTSAKIVDLLKNSGINVKTNQGPALLHHKFLYIDDAILVNGSANWTKAAFTQNDDCFMILYYLTPEQKERMDQLWSVIQAEAN
jgi:phosphatidylserine/phosphatidylglycerophosphate/cardiolipin synthase-like enzyme